MSTPNTAERNAAGNQFGTDYAAATLQIRAGTTVLATHTLAGFGAAASGVITANAIANATIAATGTADNAKLIGPSSREYDLTVGATSSGADVEIDDLSYVSGGNSVIASMTVTF